MAMKTTGRPWLQKPTANIEPFTAGSVPKDVRTAVNPTT
jgi:hypothetical protein